MAPAVHAVLVLLVCSAQMEKCAPIPAEPPSVISEQACAEAANAAFSALNAPKGFALAGFHCGYSLEPSDNEQ